MSVLKKLGSGISDYIRNTDKLLLFFCALASVYGCMLVYSVAQTSGTGRAGYLIQFAACAAGFVMAIVISKIDYELICRGWPFMAAVALGLMALTFTSLGRNVAGTDDTGLADPSPGSLYHDVPARGVNEDRLYCHLCQAFDRGARPHQPAAHRTAAVPSRRAAHPGWYFYRAIMAPRWFLFLFLSVCCLPAGSVRCISSSD